MPPRPPDMPRFGSIVIQAAVLYAGLRRAGALAHALA